jgi:hypothetical protein
MYIHPRLLHLMRNSFPSQNCFVPPWIIWVAFVIYTWLLHRNRIRSFMNLSCHLKEADESQDVRAVETRKVLRNTTVRRLACSFAWELSFLVFHEFQCNCIAISPVCAAQFSSTCSARSDKISLKLQLLVSLMCPCPNLSFHNH